MLLASLHASVGVSIMTEIKTISGWCIEARRKRSGMTQERLASQVGIAVRWLREIEGGNPKSSIDDHMRCASGVGLSPSYLLIPWMFLERDMSFPRELLLDHLPELEARCIDAMADYSLDSLARRFRPAPQNP
jgi:transcriptional regulator with XRE-family HTH domain